MPDSDFSRWVDILSHATADLDGSWVEMIASLSIASKWMAIQINCADTPTMDAQFDVAIGAGGSEVEIISDQYYRIRNQSGGMGIGSFYSFPMVLSSGVRIAMRIKDDQSGAKTYSVTLNATDQELKANTPDTSQSSGAKVVQSGGTDAYGSWVELISSLTNPSVWMCFTSYSFLTTGPKGEFDIGIGDAGSEVPILEALGFTKATPSSGKAGSLGNYFPIVIPQGSRIAIRAKDQLAAMNNYTVGAVFF